MCFRRITCKFWFGSLDSREDSYYNPVGPIFEMDVYDDVDIAYVYRRDLVKFSRLNKIGEVANHFSGAGFRCIEVHDDEDRVMYRIFGS